MIHCDSFRERFQASTEDAALLEHVRTCDRCLELAATIDPDVMFRALGGGEMIPPGGIDAFVDDVMRQVRVHETQKVVADFGRVASWPRRFAVAATVAIVVAGGALFYRSGIQSVPTQQQARVARAAVPQGSGVMPVRLTVKPIVESYESSNATIVEVPAEQTDDVQMVMIFDDKLPADL